jgi:hypothetical protein
MILIHKKPYLRPRCRGKTALKDEVSFYESIGMIYSL